MHEMYNEPHKASDAVSQVCQFFNHKLEQLPEGEITSIQDVVEIAAAVQSVVMYEAMRTMRDRLFSEGKDIGQTGEQVLAMRQHYNKTLDACIEELMMREMVGE